LCRNPRGRTRPPPSVDTWPVVTRTHVIDRLVTDAVRDGADAVRNLAAGLDTKSARIPL